ncbi:MAG: glycerol-3-phosphate 1-O-acyltransferase PlsY [Vulcanimicrobiaceae bacterium]
MLFALYALAAFLIGSVPFGYLIGRAFYRTDIRTQGSGNIGAMNALRTLGKPGAAAVLLLDAAKGFIPAYLLAAGGAPQASVALVAAAAVFGHCFSPWLGWKGGKGVATSFGAILALSWKAGLVSIGAWMLGALVFTQFSSVGSMLGNGVAPIALYLFTGSVWYVAYGAVAALLIIYTHRENIGRLRAGTENRIGLFSKRKPPRP